MQRRTFVAALGAGLVAAPGPLRAQARKPARIGFVGGWYSAARVATLYEAFRLGMRDQGYVEGENVTIEPRMMEGTSLEEAASLTAELVRSKVDLLVTQNFAVLGVKAEAGTLPVIFVYSGDPVAAKLVASLARPGSNLTGISLMSVQLTAKRVELLKEILPRATRFAALTNPLHPGEIEEARQAQAAAERIGVRLTQYPVHSVAEVQAALEAMLRERTEGIVALSNLLIMLHRSEIAEFTTKHRIATISGWDDFAAAGNLLSYGPNLSETWRQVAVYVDKVLKGAKPADLPVEQPTKFQLCVNVKTARQIGLTIPQSVLVRADEVFS
jgi:putative ABC transport system substrate-binding protein